MCSGAAHDHHGCFARIEVELFAFTYCSAGYERRSHKKLSLKLLVFVDDITAMVKGRKKEVAKKLMKS